MPRRSWRHLATDHGAVRRAFPAAALARVEAAIADGERGHRGQVCVRRRGGAAARARAAERRAARARARSVRRCSRVWDTEENDGVLVYLLLADRAVEIVADRGIHAQGGRRRVGRDLPRHGGRVSRRALRRRASIAGIAADQRAACAAFRRARARTERTSCRTSRDALSGGSGATYWWPLARSTPMRCSESPLRLVRAVAPHHEHHRARHEQSEQDDRDVDADARPAPSARRGRPSRGCRCSR